MLLIERILAAFTIWLCDLTELTQSDIERYKQREQGLTPVPNHVRSAHGGRPVQTIVRFGR